MRLTGRQHAFLERMLDVYRKHRDRPIHYTHPADALGVANATAHEMLQLLELKGYASAQYHLEQERSCPGRSTVWFQPALKALRMFRCLLGEDARSQEWEFIKDKVLHRLTMEGLPRDEDVLGDLLSAIPQSTDPLAYRSQVVAASRLSARGQLLSRIQDLSFLRDMAGGGEANADDLDLPSSFAMGLSCGLQQGSSWPAKLEQHVKKHQTCLKRLDRRTRGSLLRFMQEALAVLRAPVQTERSWVRI